MPDMEILPVRPPVVAVVVMLLLCAICYHLNSAIFTKHICDFIDYLWDSFKRLIPTLVYIAAIALQTIVFVVNVIVSFVVAVLTRRVMLHYIGTARPRMPVRDSVRDTLQEVLAHLEPRITLRVEEILSSIHFSYRKTIIARYPHLKVSYDILFRSISKYGRVHSVESHWLPKTRDCALKEEIPFRKRNGLIIRYQEPGMASTAACYLPSDIGSFCRALSLKALTERIALEEALLGRDEESNTVLVGRDTPLSEEDEVNVRRYFAAIANIISTNSRKREDQNDYEFVITYRFITHAILAIYILDGKKLGSGILTVCLQNTELATQIVKRISKKERDFVRNIF